MCAASPAWDEAGSSSSGSSSSADVTVCVQYVYGTGYTSRTLQEFAAWYLLLGAKRIVVFDSMEPSLEPTAEQPTAMERKEALHSLSVALGRRFVVVRGLSRAYKDDNLFVLLASAGLPWLRDSACA